MSYIEAKAKYAALGIDTDAAIARLKTVPVALHCWQGDDVGGFDQKEKPKNSCKKVIFTLDKGVLLWYSGCRRADPRC